MPFVRDLKVEDTAGRYFESLAQLDQWAEAPGDPLDLVPYVPLPGATDPGRRVLVCHDYKGGYVEDPAGFTYTFNHWSYCHTFVYFAHYRITIPPPGWVNACHRQGTKLLGTLIFEGQTDNEILQLIIRRLPSDAQKATPSLATSSYYARLLARLAKQRGFDGYLLNFECPLRIGPDQARAVCVWIDLLRTELRRTVGDHAEVVWYDSVIIDGQLQWQNRLNYFNAPYLRPSDALFTNYWWVPDYATATLTYYNNLNPTGKDASSVQMGLDIWGRGQYGGGGINTNRALFHVPRPLSFAIFAQGWSWEKVKEDERYDWATWWLFEQKFWLGTSPQIEAKIRDGAGDNFPGSQPDPSDPQTYEPMSKYFDKRSPFDPRTLAFFTTFNPGVGRGWFVEGVRVWDGQFEWTDIDHQNSLGDLVFPVAALTNETDASLSWTCDPEITMDNAFNGGSSLLLAFKKPAGNKDTLSTAQKWTVSCPIQSATFSPTQFYTISIWYKVLDKSADVSVDVDVLSRILGTGPKDPLNVTITVPQTTTLQEGWVRVTADLQLTTPPPKPEAVSLGLILSITALPAPESSFTLLVGQISLAPTVLPSQKQCKALVVYAEQRASDTETVTLVWETSKRFVESFDFVDVFHDQEDPVYVWDVPELARGTRPDHVYFNLYADDKWIASYDMGGKAARVKKSVVRTVVGKPNGGKVTFKIQGVSDRGEVDPLDTAVAVEVDV